MHSALVIVEKPDLSIPTERPREQSWAKLLHNLQAAVTNHKGAVEEIGEACVQITLEKKGAGALADVLHAASLSAFPYRVLFFEKAPAWIIGAGR